MAELLKGTGRADIRQEMQGLHREGHSIDIDVSATTLSDEQGRTLGFSIMAHDIREAKKAEAQLIEARDHAQAANVAKSEFLTNMSHEIRTPMNAVIGLSNILSMSEPLTPRQREFIKTLQLSADSLLALINDLLDISKIETRIVELEHIPFDLTKLTQEVISMMAVRAAEKQLTFTMEGECVKGRQFIGDPTRLRQIILNLCSNAIKFTETGGIYIGIHCHPPEEDGKETICIQVKDSGIGISPQKLGTIFDKFVQADSSITRRYGGTGLGLAITKTLAEIMGGRVTVESTFGEGSTFTVCLPMTEVSPDESHLAAIADVAEKNAPTGLRVLVVEDHAPNVLVVGTYLEQFGYRYNVASNGLEGFEKAKEGGYVAILMDVQMQGMNGFDSTGLIRAEESRNSGRRVPIIGMTAHALSGDRERCLAAGMNDYISKPFNPDELRDKLQFFIGSA